MQFVAAELPSKLIYCSVKLHLAEDMIRGTNGNKK